MGALANQIIAKVESRLDVPVPYLRTLADASGAAFSKWMLAMPATLHRSAVSKAVWHLARIGATQAQDCGTCVQVVVNDALRDGVPASVLRAAVDRQLEVLSEDEQVALAYGRAVSAQADDVLDHVAAVEARFGHDAMVEMAMAVAMCQIFPVIKRGMGQAVACSLVEIEV